MRYFIALFLTGFLLTGCARGQETPPTNPPEPQREFRGVWVATVANINWPSKPGLSVAAQKAELLAILDTASNLHLNAVLLQVRPACDALYRSGLEPWSEYLTGTMGQAPDPSYDPLEYAISAAHRRGLELHAWFNPFRALHPSSKSPIHPTHISKKRPDLVHRCGGALWLDPGEPAAREHSLKVILDVVRRYDIDAVHFDDYFYPYPEKDARGDTLPFPDEAAWKKYGSGLTRADWRRRNVDQFVQQVQQSVQAEKRWVQFGISPFGIWRPGYPKQIVGLDAYDALHADARKWLREGWVDYLAPQLYWNIASPGQSFPVLLEWWQEQNLKRRHLWPGLNTVKAGNPWPESELLNQIKLTRQFGLQGHVHWNISKLGANSPLATQLRSQFYGEPALTPATPWLDNVAPPRPKLETYQPNPARVIWTPSAGESAWRWLLQSRTPTGWKTELLREESRDFAFPAPLPDWVALRAIDRCGNLSEPAFLRLKP